MTNINHNQTPLTFNELFNEYLQVMKHTMSEKTCQTKIYYYNKHFKEKYGNIIITSFKFKDAQLFVNELLSKNLQPKTVKNIIDIFKVLYKYAIMNEYCEKNPFEYVQLPQFDNRIYFSFTEEEIKRFIKTALNYPDQKFRGIFTFLLHGRRLNEVLSLTWENVDFENEVYFIPPQINKAKRLMTYQMTDLLKDVLQRQKMLKEIECPTSPYVFPSSVTCRKIQDIRKQFKKLLSLAKINKKMRIHDIRHLVASYSINYLGLSVEEVSYTLGHTSIEITQRYINPRAEISKKVITKIFDSVQGV
ncbi:tyrosine-type recombinase/integrase [Caminibacter sp.]